VRKFNLSLEIFTLKNYSTLAGQNIPKFGITSLVIAAFKIQELNPVQMQ
jgi:hypothetical protein